MSESLLSEITIMIPPIRPDLDLDSEIEEMEKRIKEKGLMATVDEILEEYNNWEKDPNPISSRKKRRAILIFSKPELRRIIALEVSTLLGFYNCRGYKKD